MSQERGRLAGLEFDGALAEVRRRYHIPALALLMVFILWVRARSWRNFLFEDQILFAGNDPWYHYRQTMYIVQNFPHTMPFDPWTNFPHGTSSAQFGSLFDQLVATVLVVVGLGNPSERMVAIGAILAPAVVAMLVAIPIFLIGRRLGGKAGGIAGVVILAFSSGGFLNRSLAGFYDHHVSEVLFMSLAVLGFMVALSVSERELPVWELVTSREWGALRRPVGWSVLAGVALGLYIWQWPPGVWLVGILGIFFVVHLTVEYLRDRSPEPVAFVGAVGLTVGGVLTLVPITSLEFSPTDFTLLQPLLAFAVAGGCVFMAWLARALDDRDLDRRAYPATVLGGLVLGGVLLAVVLPDAFSTIVTNIQRTIGLGTTATSATVAEASAPDQPIAQLTGAYGIAYITALAGVAILARRYVGASRTEGESLFVVVLAVILTLAFLTQSRFEYYLVIPITVLNAVVVKSILGFVTSGEETTDIRPFHVLVALTLLLLLVAPMTVAGASVLDTANNGPSAENVAWNDGMNWMDENTPVQGTYGGENNELDYYGTYERTENFDYPAGTYGTLSWWDYGHRITVQGERIPTANPFQQGANEAANFLLAPNETQAETVVDRMSDENAKPQYVVVDWKLVTNWGRPVSQGIFSAPPAFYTDGNVSQSDFYTMVQNPQGAYYLKSQRYYESMLSRLWYFHGSAQDPQPVVAEWDEAVERDGQEFYVVRGEGPHFRTFDDTNRNSDATLAEAREYADQQGTAQVGGFGPNPPERVDALEHYRLVHNAQRPSFLGPRSYRQALQATTRGLAGNVESASTDERRSIQQQVQSLLLPNNAIPPWLKIFERVPGATVEGTGPANATITAQVQMEAPTNGEQFTYTQQVETGPDGEFEMTVPYSTTGYDEWGPDEGYTDVSVRANTEYQFSTPVDVNDDGQLVHYIDTANVTEGQVVGEDDTPVQVELQQEVVSERGGDGTQSDGSQDGDGQPTDDSGATETDAQSSVAGPTGADAEVSP